MTARRRENRRQMRKRTWYQYHDGENTERQKQKQRQRMKLNFSSTPTPIKRRRMIENEYDDNSYLLQNNQQNKPYKYIYNSLSTSSTPTNIYSKPFSFEYDQSQNQKLQHPITKYHDTNTPKSIPIPTPTPSPSNTS